MKKKDIEAYYRKIMMEAQKYERLKNVKEAVKKYRESLYIEIEIFNKPGLSMLALERIGENYLKKSAEFAQKGEIRQAKEAAEMAVYCKPWDVKTLKTAGELSSHSGEDELTLTYLQAAYKKNPGDTQLKYQLKNLYLHVGFPEKAIPLITKDISSHCRLKTHWLELAEAYYVLYRKNPQKEEMQKKIDDALGKAMLSQSFSNAGKTEIRLIQYLFYNKFEDALKELDKLEFTNTDPSYQTRFLYNRGLLYLALGKRNEAASFFNKTIERMSGHRNILPDEKQMAIMSAWMLDGMGKRNFSPEEAEKIFSHFESTSDSCRREFEIIREYLSARERKGWMGAVNALLKLTGKRQLELLGDYEYDTLHLPAKKALIYISIGQMLERSGKKDEASQSYEKVRDNHFLGYRARELLNKLK